MKKIRKKEEEGIGLASIIRDIKYNNKRVSSNSTKQAKAMDGSDYEDTWEKGKQVSPFAREEEKENQSMNNSSIKVIL